jgi:hypothetical protein
MLNAAPQTRSLCCGRRLIERPQANRERDGMWRNGNAPKDYLRYRKKRGSSVDRLPANDRNFRRAVQSDDELWISKLKGNFDAADTRQNCRT